MLDSILFDDEKHFAGFVFYDQVLLETKYMIASKHMHVEAVKLDDEILKNHENTRLIGFRTTKRCHTAKQTMSVQPIFFSVNRDLCENYLDGIDMAMMDELTHHGPECSDPLITSSSRPAATNASLNMNGAERFSDPERFLDHRKLWSSSVGIIYSTFALLLALVIAQVYLAAKKKKYRKESK